MEMWAIPGEQPVQQMEEGALNVENLTTKQEFAAIVPLAERTRGQTSCNWVKRVSCTMFPERRKIRKMYRNA